MLLLFYFSVRVNFPGVDAFFIYIAFGLIVGVITLMVLRSGEGDCRGIADGITRKSISIPRRLGLIR